MFFFSILYQNGETNTHLDSICPSMIIRVLLHANLEYDYFHFISLIFIFWVNDEEEDKFVGLIGFYICCNFKFN